MQENKTKSIAPNHLYDRRRNHGNSQPGSDRENAEGKLIFCLSAEKCKRKRPSRQGQGALPSVTLDGK